MYKCLLNAFVNMFEEAFCTNLSLMHCHVFQGFAFEPCTVKKVKSGKLKTDVFNFKVKMMRESR